MSIDYPDWATSEHHALAIFNQTVPLGSGSNLIDQRTVTITATNSQSFGPFPVGQIGNELAISFGATNGSAHTLKVKETWSDIGTGLTTDIDTYGIRSGPLANPHVLRCFGRTKGSQCLLTLDNSATGFDATITYVWLQQSRVYQRETFRTLAWGANVGDALPNSDFPTNLLCQSAPNIGANGQVTRNLAAWAGQVWLHAETNSGTSDLEVRINDQSIANDFVYDNFTDSKGNLSATVTLPRSQCQLIVTNHNAAAQIANITILIAPPE